MVPLSDPSGSDVLLPTPATCSKRRYDSKSAANAKLDRIDAERPRARGRKLPIRSYWCVHCRGYHLTSKALVR